MPLRLRYAGNASWHGERYRAHVRLRNARPSLDQGAKAMSIDPKESARMVTVCDACLRAICWRGIMMCDDSHSAGTTRKSVAELAALNLEHSDWYVASEDYPEPDEEESA